MSKICNAGLIFVPSHNGISHSPYEYTKTTDLIAGLDVLYNTVLRLANE
jgi:acetylornithine deacetylase/succinyl-diaminopimelate desuccinylase-like protein